MGSFLTENPDADILDLERQARESNEKSLMPFAFVRLVSAWNTIADENNKVDLAPFVDPMRKHYLDSVDSMQRLIGASVRLHDVFRPAWFDALRLELRAWRGTEEFTTNTYGAFISFLQFGDDEEGLLRQIDNAFLTIGEATQRRLSTKLRDMRAGMDTYISTAFEILITARFPVIVAYEPVISSGRPEARVRLDTQTVLIEARATRDMPLIDGPFDPDDVGRVLASKAREKYAGQLRGAEEPVILFFAMNVAVNRMQVESMLRRIEEDPEARVLSAIVYSDTFHALGFRLWIHPNPIFPLSNGALAELRRLFEIG